MLGLRNLLVAGVGALALAVGAVALLNGGLIGIVFLIGGALLLVWSVRSLRPRQ